MHKKSKKNKFKSSKVSNMHKWLKHKQNVIAEGEKSQSKQNEVIHASQLVKNSPEEKKQIIQSELKMRRKDEKLLIFNANRNISKYASCIKEPNVGNFEGSKEKNIFTDRSGKAYCKELRKVIEASDVILEVLDARDPQGCRSLPVEEMILKAPNKRLILVLNKADLVPKDCLDAWLKYFRSQHPTLLFKSSTQKQAANLSHAKIKNSKYTELCKTSKCVGASALMQLLKNYCRNSGIKTIISVGVVGLPNVGKSSLINSLRRMRACNVGATPGVTKTLQEVSLDSKIRIIDCPGLILASKDDSDIQASLRNAIKIEKLKDLITPVQAIFEKVGKEELTSFYKVANFEDVQEFLSLLALKHGRVKKGGSPDVDKAAVMVLRDWNMGKIKYYTYPPSRNQESSQLSSVVVETFSKEFNLEELEESNGDALRCLSGTDDSESEMEDDSYPNEERICGQKTLDSNNLHEIHSVLPNNVEIKMSSVPKNSAPGLKPKKLNDRTLGVPLRKFQKKQMKKLKKEQRRHVRRTDELIDNLESLVFPNSDK